jgi:hypothetical protein
MVRPLSVFLPVALAATAVNAQLGDFIKNAFGGVISQKPLASGIPSALIEKNTHQITSENWRSAINVTVDPAASEGDAKEWLFYFTTKASNATSARNVTYWDGVYNVRLLYFDLYIRGHSSLTNRKPSTHCPQHGPPLSLTSARSIARLLPPRTFAMPSI